MTRSIETISMNGIVADALIPDLHLLPGLWKIDGYTRVAEMIKAGFKVEEGKNFFTFPYDWRRDNRVSARKLARWPSHWDGRGTNAGIGALPRSALR